MASLLRDRPAPVLALWAAPAAALAVLTALAGTPSVPAEPPPLGEAALVLARLTAQLYASVFLVVWFAAPTARLAAGAGLGEAARALGRHAVVGVAALVALFASLALMLTLFPGLLASYVNALMAQIFLVAGTIVGAAAAVGVFARWMFAPGLASAGLGATEALDRSRALARAQRTFGFAAGLAVLLGVSALAGGALSVAAGLAGAPLPLRAAASWAPLWLGLTAVAGMVAARQQAPLAERAAPRLALRARPSRCPRCGALATVAVEGPREASCPACGLRGLLR